MNINLKLIFILLFITCLSYQQLNQVSNWTNWIKNNSKPILLSSSETFSDLKFLEDILKDKRIVFLGENAHGVSEYNTIKSRLIQYLHQELDYTVLAFETNAADAFAVNLEFPYDSAEKALYNSVSSFWHVQENLPLFEYINDRASGRPLAIAGIDITQNNGSYAFSRFLKSILDPINSNYAEKIRREDSLFSAIGIKKWTLGLKGKELNIFDSLKQAHLSKYKGLIEFLKTRRNIIHIPNKEIEAAIFYTQSRIDFIHWINRDSTYMANLLEVSPERNKSIEWLFKQFRERLQSENLKFLANTLYPDEKIIVWAHNTHIEKVNKNRMPHRLSLQDSIYTIALFNYSGEGCFSFGQGFDGTPLEEMVYKYHIPTDTTRIEYILATSGYEATFVDMKNQERIHGNSWMYNNSKYADWDGTNVNEANNIRDKWDALIVVKQIKPPTYLNFEYDYLSNK